MCSMACLPGEKLVRSSGGIGCGSHCSSDGSRCSSSGGSISISRDISSCCNLSSLYLLPVH